MIDALDHDLLRLLAQRLALVAEAAAYKHEHGLRIHDEERERAVLEDRRVHARALGLPEREIEAIFRLLLQVSRSHQGTLRADAPQN
jgi:chorismate mutase-like protein